MVGTATHSTIVTPSMQETSHAYRTTGAFLLPWGQVNVKLDQSKTKKEDD